MPSKHLILCHPLLLPSVFSSIRVFSNESALLIRWPKYWSFSFIFISGKALLELLQQQGGGEQKQTSGPLACLLPKEGMSCSLCDVGPGIGPEGWLSYFAHPLGAACKGVMHHTLILLPILCLCSRFFGAKTAGFLVSWYLLPIICTNCP